MANLVVLIVGIALLAAITAISINYLPIDAQLRQAMFKEADRGIKALECAATRYLDASRGPDGNIVYPGDGVNLVSAIAPAYGFMPADVSKEMTWNVSTGSINGMPAVGICLHSIKSATKTQQEVLARLQSQLPVGSAYVANGCNAVADSAGGDALTYWIPVAHVN